jgi:hypothetical protein
LVPRFAFALLGARGSGKGGSGRGGSGEKGSGGGGSEGKGIDKVGLGRGRIGKVSLGKDPDEVMIILSQGLKNSGRNAHSNTNFKRSKKRSISRL